MEKLVTPGGLRVDPAALSWTSTRSGGPGGQHANTSDTAVVATLDLAAAGLEEAVRRQLVAELGQVVTARAADTRSQWRNRQLAWTRLAERLDTASRTRRDRRRSRPSQRAVADRLDDKRRRGDLKRARQTPGRDDG